MEGKPKGSRVASGVLGGADQAASHGCSSCGKIRAALSDQVQVDGAPVERRRAPRAYTFHKPVGVVSTVCDPDGHTDLAPALARCCPGTFPVGRLDRDSSGLLLLTNDGDLANALLSSAHHVEKEYELRLDRWVASDDPGLQRLTAGVQLEDGPARAQRVQLVANGSAHGDRSDTLAIVLQEGRHRQLRRMCRRVGWSVRALARVRIGSLRLEGLPPGAVQVLELDELERLWHCAGTRELVEARKRVALVRRAARARAAGGSDERLEAWLRPR
jgi:23S rRNA pseudouridine2605 synthase